MQNLDWTDVESSNVRAVAFDDKTATICVQFLNGGLYSYTYHGVPPGMDPIDPYTVYVTLAHAASVGQFLDRVIKKGPFDHHKWSSEDELLNSLSHS
jgi:hypothetical protein